MPSTGAGVLFDEASLLSHAFVATDCSKVACMSRNEVINAERVPEVPVPVRYWDCAWKNNIYGLRTDNTIFLARVVLFVIVL